LNGDDHHQLNKVSLIGLSNAVKYQQKKSISLEGLKIIDTMIGETRFTRDKRWTDYSWVEVFIFVGNFEWSDK
jgi:hypothetical protein